MKIEIPTPEWNSDIAKTILNLEKLRTRRLGGQVPAYVFFQLKNIFQLLETLGSARIEGNNTTLIEYVEKIIEKKIDTPDESTQELENIEKAMAFIEENAASGTPINRSFISDLHKITTQKLTPPPHGEGSSYPGDLRKDSVAISQSEHIPPVLPLLQEYFDSFIDFINSDFSEQNQLLMVAIAHHRFMYVHPFDNGNGRMGRLLNYAFLIKLGFNVDKGRIINPSSVFYADRDKYYQMLGKADSLEKDDLLAWAEYFLFGLNNEIQKIDKLLEVDYTRNEILKPTLSFALERENITKQEFDILNLLIRLPNMELKAGDLEQIGFKGTPQQKSSLMGKLKDKEMICPKEEGGRIYQINFANSYLLRGIIKTLNDKGFVAEFLNKN